jgi:hypothetical protein
MAAYHGDEELSVSSTLKIRRNVSLNHSYLPGLHCHIPRSFVITIYDPEDGFIVFLRKVLFNQTTLRHAPQKRLQIMKLPISGATSSYFRTVPVRLGEMICAQAQPCELQQQSRSYCNFNEWTDGDFMDILYWWVQCSQQAAYRSHCTHGAKMPPSRFVRRTPRELITSQRTVEIQVLLQLFLPVIKQPPWKRMGERRHSSTYS